ncbi:MAG: flagellar motor switch phosphatase FliY, partial [Lachnospiraceae bacterium]|nr:flagellar motor switch phosphatase FliY [Lachnospiraceae bacterium]
MDGQLSQDEINALLAGMTTDDGGGDGGAAPAASGGGAPIDDSLLTDVEKDAIGEIANINMGSSATTLFSLVNHKVDITTPNVELSNWQGVVSAYERPCVFITIKYTIGVDGSNVLILKERDVMVITDLMMGGDGTNVEGEIGELQLSAISEAMNQMMGAAATSLSTMIGEKVDISPPVATLEDFADQDPGKIAEFLTGTFVKISFQMKIGDLVDSVLMQLYPIDFAKSLYDTFNTGGASEPAPAAAPEPAAA